MTTAASDYATAVAAVRSQSLPALIEYTQISNAHGLKGWQGTPQRIVVDTRTKKVVSVEPRDGEQNDNDSPVTQRLFNPDCYDPTSERTLQWNGQVAIAIAVRSKAHSCNDGLSVNTIYADPATGTILGADGSDTEENMTADVSVHYGTFGAYVVPTAISVHVHGHGWLFWARERAEVTYSNYNFNVVRRQSP